MREWWARARGIACRGPYASQRVAWREVLGPDGTPLPDAVVWVGPPPRDFVRAPQRAREASGAEDSLGSRVRQVRTARGLTLAELDEAAGLSPGHAGAIERGRRSNPGASTLEKLAKGLDVPVAWILVGGSRVPAIGPVRRG